MKSILTVTAIALALVAPSLRAQEESPTPNEKLSLRATDPSETEPTVSVPSERSSADYPAPGTPLVSPPPSPTATATKTSRSTTKAKPTATATPKATPSTSAPTTTSKAAEPAVKELENRWLSALQTHDANTVQTMVADDYIGVTATGKFVNKTALLGEIRKDKNNYGSATNMRMDVRVHGDAAVIVGTTRQVGKDAAGKEFTYFYRWTDTWAQRGGKWLCVASQSIQVPK